MNATEEQLKKYLETFHKSLEETAKEFLPKDQISNLLHLSFLPAKITGYVSTQFGIAIEYIQSEKTYIEFKKGSSRVEDLIFNAPKRIRNSGPMISSAAINLRLTGGSWNGAFPIRLASIGASIKISQMKCSAEGWERFIEYAEIYGDRKSEHWDEAKAISRAKDEVLVALTELKKAASLDIPPDEHLKAWKKKTILLLGDYSEEGTIRLESIRSSLKELGYNPIIVKEIPEHPEMSLSQKVTALASISRFVVIDDTSSSGHLVEISKIKNDGWVTILLHANGKRSSFMTADASIYSSVIFEIDYNPEQPLENVSAATKWAEEKLKELGESLKDRYPWRNPIQ